MGDPNCCHAILFSSLLALPRRKETNWPIIATPVQWILQKLQSPKNRLSPCIFERSGVDEWYKLLNTSTIRSEGRQPHMDSFQCADYGSQILLSPMQHDEQMVQECWSLVHAVRSLCCNKEYLHSADV